MVAPGVSLTEQDLSTVVRGRSDVPGGLVGKAVRGRANVVVPTTDTKNFKDNFGDPVPGNYFHYTGLAFLGEGNLLYAVRALNSDLTTLYGGVAIMEEDASLENVGIGVGENNPENYIFTDETFLLTGDNPGVWNNSVKVTITNVDDTALTFTITAYELNSDTGVYVEVGSWDVSRVQLKKDGFGKSMYLEDVINDNNRYIRVFDNTDVAESVLPKENSTQLALDGGADGTDPAASDIATAWELFENKDDFFVNVLMAGGWTDAVVINKMVNDIASARQDCTAIIDTPNDLTPTEAVAWRDTLTGLTTPSYGAAYYPWVKDTDEVNDKLLELPPSGYVGAVYAKTNRVATVYTPPFGVNRGVLPVEGIVRKLKQSEADLVFDSQVNPIMLFPGFGVTVWGEGTLQASASALSNVHVRRLLNTDEQAVLEYLMTIVGENNTEFRRAQVTQTLESYFEPLIAKEAYYDVEVVCDGTNNTSQVIDDNELAVDIYVQPVRGINNIPIKVIITRTGVDLQELAASAVL